jgi:DNA-binding transcriptional regulator YiaG
VELREMRTRLGWSQERTANEFGVTVRTVHNWERSGPPKPVLMLLEAKLKPSLRQKAAV